VTQVTHSLLAWPPAFALTPVSKEDKEDEEQHECYWNSNQNFQVPFQSLGTYDVMNEEHHCLIEHLLCVKPILAYIWISHV
jgi:hypothetical protein